MLKNLHLMIIITDILDPVAKFEFQKTIEQPECFLDYKTHSSNNTSTTATTTIATS
jgi:hypothetical protein